MAVCLVGLWAQAADAVEISANAVYGQPSLVQIGVTMPADQRIYQAKGLAVTSEGLYVSDYQLHRVLFFPAGEFAATRVYGQPNFTTTSSNTGGPSAASLYAPQGIAADESGLYVADSYNSRVLHYPPGSTVADRVYGQPNFTSVTANTAGISGTTLNYPQYVALEPGGGLYIADTFNQRVLYYPPGETQPAFVYGQPDFTSSLTGIGPSRMYMPTGLAADASGVYVVDYGNHRVLFFPKGSKIATRVYGQPDYYSTIPNAFGIGPQSLMRPVDCALDEHGLYVVEYLNSRVTFFPNGSTVASVVYGQPDFNTLGLNQYGISGYGFYVPWGITVSDDYVYASDYVSRVLRFPKVLTPMPADAAFQTAPVGARAGDPLSVQPAVIVRRSDGSPAVDFNGPVTVRLKPNVGTDCGKLMGQTTVNAVGGVATFSGLAVDTPGEYRLQALASSLPVATSDAFEIGLRSGEGVPGDVNKDGVFDIRDVTRHLRATAGLEVLP